MMVRPVMGNIEVMLGKDKTADRLGHLHHKRGLQRDRDSMDKHSVASSLDKVDDSSFSYAPSAFSDMSDEKEGDVETIDSSPAFSGSGLASVPSCWESVAVPGWESLQDEETVAASHLPSQGTPGMTTATSAADFQSERFFDVPARNKRKKSQPVPNAPDKCRRSEPWQEMEQQLMASLEKDSDDDDDEDILSIDDEPRQCS